ncbi:glycan biosynthesis hexose transferase WsfD [Anaeromicropila herbilytica]|uniref:Transmembrane protein n=1 Tax=Anaeromicropila herbilytica TaxID=2785025 RepID=A0A7R7EJH5_9FIRM|nr:hypothetical protein [Anaeromicropila herbilytica]BCN29937.1 hypothetical protein bsdtb5_12320 [Anaeromicropila herbilytica]
MESREQSKTVERIKLVVYFIKKMNDMKRKVNRRMEGKYSPSLIAFFCMLFSLLLVTIMLFLPNCKGVANDGTLDKIMNATNVHYIQTDKEDIYNNYFVKNYSRVLSGGQEVKSVISSHVFFVKAAVFMDDIFTRDKFFDIRFLALIYSLFYLPASYLIIKQACARVKRFSEGFVIGGLGILIFSDVAYITYFNSFYPEAIWFITMLYCIGATLSFQEKRSGYIDLAYLILYLASASILISSKRQCAIIGIILAVYCIKLVFVRKNWLWSVICVLSALYLAFLSILCVIKLGNDFNETSKFHAMTRGVLFQSDNPEKTLEEFNIAPSYEMLADVSAYDSIPFIKVDDISLKHGFLDQYTSLDIGAYYLRHPSKLFGMINISIKSSLNVRRSYCGNYQKSAGMPEKAKSLFWSAWSTFKDTSAPKTIGYLILLTIAIVLLFGKKYTLRPDDDRRSTVFLDNLIGVIIILLSQAIITIVNSGDAEMIQHCFLVGLGIDILSYFVFAEIIHKINII